MAEFVMPSLGADMDHGTLTEWLVVKGQVVQRGDLIAVIETDKGAIEVEVWVDGKVEEFLVEEGTEVPVGTPLARIKQRIPSGFERSAPKKWKRVTSAKRARDTGGSRHKTLVPVPASAGPYAGIGLVSPWARHLAAERGVDLGKIKGTGPDGAIVGADVEKAMEQAMPDVGKRKARTNPDAMRRAVAKAMERSKREIPHYYVGTEVDMEPALTWLERTNAMVPPPERVLPAALLLRATAKSISKVPEVNGFWRKGRLNVSQPIHLGVAISLRSGGLVAPAIREADHMDLHDLMEKLNDLVRRARRGRLRGSEMTDATITMSSMGDRGVSEIQGIIYPPQVALVGFGRIVERPWVVDGQVVPRRIMKITLAGDHRAHDGHVGALYLNEVRKNLENPELMA